jgi:hypothetical protein
MAQKAIGWLLGLGDSIVRIIVACILALTLAGALALSLACGAFAQSPQCMPGGSCCINGTCGTLEQFKRNATIVCLQADAIENKSLPQSIELAGRCTAAQIMAERVESTQPMGITTRRTCAAPQRRLAAAMRQSNRWSYRWH